MKITVLSGDGIGPEVTREAVKVLTSVSSVFGINIDFDEQLVGSAAIDACGDPLPRATADSCEAADAVLLGAVGAPKHDHLPPDQRPEKGLLRLRTLLGGFANLRPAKAIPSLLDASPLRREVFEGTDILIVRELLGGLYFGEPRGTKDGGKTAYNTMVYSESEIERVARIAFEAARLRKKKLTSVDKANVLEVSRLWRETVVRVANDYPDVTVDHLFVDACAMMLATNPSRFDVVLTENLFGDILSDEAAVLTGSLGTLASATIGGKIDLYEPVHGSAPDIAGKNIANPIGAIASAAMLLRYTARHETAAACIELAIEKTLEEGHRSADLAGAGSATSTTALGDIIANRAVEAAAGHSATA